MNILKKYDQLSYQLNEEFSRLGITSSLSDFELEELGNILDNNRDSITKYFEVYAENDQKFSDILKEIELSYQTNKEPPSEEILIF